MIANIALFCGFLLIAVVTVFFLWQTLFPSKDHRAKPNAQATHSEQQSGNKDLGGTSVAPAHTNPAEEAIAEYTRWLAFFTAALVFATIALFISGERNVEVARESAEAAGRSANAAKEAADAARNSITLAKDTMQLDQRAWIVLESIAPVPLIPEVGKTFGVTGVIKNTGKTPARNIVIYSIIEPVDAGRLPNFSYDGVPKLIGGLLSPNIPATLPLNVLPDAKTKQPALFSQEQLDIFKSKKSVIYAHGRIEYEDIFGNIHWMTYCSYLPFPPISSMAFCAEHNDTDDYQPAKK
jgi:hypothetical protein